MLEELKELFCTMLEQDFSFVTPETRLREDLQFDSLNMIWLAFAIENKFEIQLHDVSLNELVTVNDVCVQIAKLQEEA